MSSGFIFLVVTIAIAGVVVWVNTRGETVGSLRCKSLGPGGYFTSIRFVVKRVGTNAGVPQVDFQTRASLAVISTVLDEREALRLAEMLEEAVTKVRAP